MSEAVDLARGRAPRRRSPQPARPAATSHRFVFWHRVLARSSAATNAFDLRPNPSRRTTCLPDPDRPASRLPRSRGRTARASNCSAPPARGRRRARAIASASTRSRQRWHLLVAQIRREPLHLRDVDSVDATRHPAAAPAFRSSVRAIRSASVSSEGGSRASVRMVASTSAPSRRCFAYRGS
jgi:hypothetical protein